MANDSLYNPASGSDLLPSKSDQPRTAQNGFLFRRRSCPRRELPAEQLALFAAKPPVLEELEKLDISSMTQLEAVTKLYELRQKAKEE